MDPDHEALHLPGEHNRVIAAVIGADPEAAKGEMQTHLKKFCKSLIAMETAYRQKSIGGRT